MPPGITFSNGYFTGTPTTTGTYSISVTLTLDNINCAPNATVKTVSLKVVCGAFTFPYSISNGDTTNAYSVSIGATGGGSATKSYTASGLPSGLTMSVAGLISGTATQIGDFTATVNVSTPSPAACYSTHTITFSIVCGAISISDTQVASGGTSPYTYSTSGNDTTIGFSFVIH